MARVFVAGHKGMVGSAIVRALASQGCHEIITADRARLDLLDHDAVSTFIKSEKIDVIYLAAARVGGIHANNSYPAEFIYQNLMIATNVIHAAHMADVDKLLFLGSSCIYPRACPQPMAEDALLTGVLEPTNEPYAISKIAGIKLCESYNRQYGRDYRSVMPTNLYGIGDNFHPENSHVIAALLRRFHEAKIDGRDTVTVWGTGAPLREFLHVDDMASACLFVRDLGRQKYDAVTRPMSSFLNVGSGEEVSIKTLAEIIARVIGFKGHVDWDSSKPDGTPRKLLDVGRLHALGWGHRINLEHGLASTYDWFKQTYLQTQ